MKGRLEHRIKQQLKGIEQGFNVTQTGPAHQPIRAGAYRYKVLHKYLKILSDEIRRIVVAPMTEHKYVSTRE
jgi:hypothetical protein